MAEEKRLDFFERYLSVWVALCIVIGIGFGKLLPGVVDAMSRLEVSGVNLIIAVLIWLMIYPMMLKIDFSAILKVGDKPKGLFIGFIGLEVCENLIDLGIRVSLVEKLPQVTPGLDSDMAQYVQDHLVSHGIQVITKDGVSEIYPNYVVLASGETLAADMVIIATGVRPKVDLAQNAGIIIN